MFDDSEAVFPTRFDLVFAPLRECWRSLGQHLVELVSAENRTQRRLRELACGAVKILHLNNRFFRVDNAKIDDGVAMRFKTFELKIVNKNSKLTKLVNKDPLLQNELKEASDKSFELAIGYLSLLFDQYDDKAAELMSQGKEAEAKKLLSKIEKKALDDVNVVYVDYQKKRKEYKNDKQVYTFNGG